MNLFHRSSVVSLLFLSGLLADAQVQQPFRCGSEPTLSPALAAAARAAGGARGSDRYLKVKVIIASMPGPGGDASAPSVVQSDLDGLNAVYAHNLTGIQFVLCGPVQVVDDESLYNLWQFDPADLNPYYEPGYLTLVYVNFLPNGLAGFAFGDLVFLRGTGNVPVIAHEVGHALGLMHTHDTVFGAELVDGSNCTTAGDLICDTPAEPDLSQPGLVDPWTCTYIGTITDGNGDPYTPMPTNVMSYSACFGDTLTPGQGQLMRYVLDNVKTNLHWTVAPVIIDPFGTRQCHNSGSLGLSASPGPGVFAGPLVTGNTIVNAPNTPGEYYVTYTPDALPEDSSTHIDQALFIFDQYGNYQHNRSLVDTVVQTLRAAADGRFTAVDLYVHDSLPNTFRLRLYAGIAPDTVLLHDALLPTNAIPDTAWIAFAIGGNVPVYTDSMYTLLLTAGHDFHQMTGFGANWAYYDYTRGSSNLSMWGDAVFRTWVHALPVCQQGLRYYELYQPPAHYMLNLATSYCASMAEPVTLFGDNLEGVGSSIWINGVQTDEFVPMLLGEGNHLVQYVNTTFGCTDTTDMPFIVTTPELSIDNLDVPICDDTAPFPLIASPAGGTFTIDGAPTGLLDPAALGIGAHSASYSYTAQLDTVAFRDQWCCGLSAYPYFIYPSVPPLAVISQSFTPAFTGRLDSILVALFPNQHALNYAVRLYAGEGTGGTLIGSDTITAAIYTGEPDLLGNIHPDVLEDSIYTFLFERLPDTVTVNQPVLYTFGNDSYTRGDADVNGVLGTDLWFKEYVSRTYSCTDSVEVPFEVEVCTGVIALQQEGFSVGPNPFNEVIAIRSAIATGYVLCNSLGAEVLAGSIRPGSTAVVDARALAPGLYTLRSIGGEVPPIAVMKVR
ncbi:MAG: hypothetical protein ABI599_02555 [Flavobacteriales bacterium]